MTNTAILPTHFQVGSDVVRGEGTAVMLRNFGLAKGLDLPISPVAPTIKEIARLEAIESLPPLPSLQDIADAGLLKVHAYRHKPSGDIIVIGSTCSIKAFGPLPADADVVRVEHVVDLGPLPEWAEQDLAEVYAVAEDESNHSLLAQRDDEESRLHQIYDELSALDIVSLRKRASQAGLKGAYKGYAKTELVTFLFNKAKSA